jgi:hypothetical protein
MTVPITVSDGPRAGTEESKLIVAEQASQARGIGFNFQSLYSQHTISD